MNDKPRGFALLKLDENGKYCWKDKRGELVGFLHTTQLVVDEIQKLDTTHSYLIIPYPPGYEDG